MQPRKQSLFSRIGRLLAVCLLVLAVVFWFRRNRPERLMDLPPGQVLTIRNGTLFLTGSVTTGGDPIQFVRSSSGHGFISVRNPNYRSYEQILRLPIGVGRNAGRPILQESSINYMTTTQDGIYYLQPVDPAALAKRQYSGVSSRSVSSRNSVAPGSSVPTESIEEFTFPTASVRLKRLPFIGGGPEPLLTITRGYSGISLNENIAIVGDMVYWVDLRPSHIVLRRREKSWSPEQMFMSSLLMRAPLNGGKPSEVVTGLLTQNQLIAGDDGVYCATSPQVANLPGALYYIGNSAARPQRISIRQSVPEIPMMFVPGFTASSLLEQSGHLYYLQNRYMQVPGSPRQAGVGIQQTQTAIIQADIDGGNGKELYTLKGFNGNIALLKVYRDSLYFTQTATRTDKSSGKYYTQVELHRIRLDLRSNAETLFKLPSVPAPYNDFGTAFFDGDYLYFTVTEERETSKDILRVPVLYRYRLPS